MVLVRVDLGLPGAFFLPIFGSIHLSWIWSSKLPLFSSTTLISCSHGRPHFKEYRQLHLQISFLNILYEVYSARGATTKTAFEFLSSKSYILILGWCSSYLYLSLASNFSAKWNFEKNTSKTDCLILFLIRSTSGMFVEISSFHISYLIYGISYFSTFFMYYFAMCFIEGNSYLGRGSFIFASGELCVYRYLINMDM